jgi:hypothetical protein
MCLLMKGEKNVILTGDNPNCVAQRNRCIHLCDNKTDYTRKLCFSRVLTQKPRTFSDVSLRWCTYIFMVLDRL